MYYRIPFTCNIHSDREISGCQGLEEVRKNKLMQIGVGIFEGEENILGSDSG